MDTRYGARGWYGSSIPHILGPPDADGAPAISTVKPGGPVPSAPARRPRAHGVIGRSRFLSRAGPNGTRAILCSP